MATMTDPQEEACQENWDALLDRGADKDRFVKTFGRFVMSLFEDVHGGQILSTDDLTKEVTGFIESKGVDPEPDLIRVFVEYFLDNRFHDAYRGVVKKHMAKFESSRATANAPSSDEIPSDVSMPDNSSTVEVSSVSTGMSTDVSMNDA